MCSRTKVRIARMRLSGWASSLRRAARAEVVLFGGRALEGHHRGLRLRVEHRAARRVVADGPCVVNGRLRGLGRVRDGLLDDLVGEEGGVDLAACALARGIASTHDGRERRAAGPEGMMRGQAGRPRAGLGGARRTVCEPRCATAALVLPDARLEVVDDRVRVHHAVQVATVFRLVVAAHARAHTH